MTETCHDQADTRPSPDPTISSVCHEFGVCADELKSSTRKANVSTPRKVLMYLLRQQGWTLEAIGALLGRHHSTVLYGVRDIQQRVNDSLAMQASIERINLGANQ